MTGPKIHVKPPTPPASARKPAILHFLWAVLVLGTLIYMHQTGLVGGELLAILLLSNAGGQGIAEVLRRKTKRV